MSGIADIIALSPLQEGLFSLARLAGEEGDKPANGDVYTIPLVIDITGPLDTAVLRASMEAILVRHPNLRAIFWDKDVPKPVQIVPAAVTLPWTEHDLSDEESEAFTAEEMGRGFDLSEGPALAANLIRLPERDGVQRHRLTVTVHHILMDGWSLGVFFGELLRLYDAGGQPDSIESVRPYRDYIAWLAAQDSADMLDRWSSRLRSLSGPLMFADTSTSTLGGAPSEPPVAHHHIVDASTTSALAEWARAQQITLNTAVQFAWTLMLSRLTDRLDVVYGTVVTGRPHQVPDSDRMIGLFLNTIPVPFRIDPAATVGDECRRLQRESADLREIGYLSLSEVQRAAGHSALFDTMFIFQNAPIDQAGDLRTRDGVQFAPVMGQNLTHYPLTVVAHLRDDELLVAIEASAERIPLSPDVLAELFLDTLAELPTADHRAVGAFDIMSASHRDRLVRTATTPGPPVPQHDVFAAFATQVTATPDAIALTDATHTLTYRELHERALRLATRFRDAGAGPERFVAIALPRGVDSIIAILASLATGAAYVPVDPTLPETRIAAIEARTDPAVWVVDSTGSRFAVPPRPAGAPRSAMATVDLGDPDVRAAISAGEPAPATPRRGAGAAYAIFTSGSTGEPKGVVNTDTALLSYAADHRERVYRGARARLGRPLRIAHAWSLSFDASWQPMVGLLDGHTVHLFGDDALRDTDLLVGELRERDIDMIDTTPSMFRQLAHAGLVEADESGARRQLTVLALGGEAIDAELWGRLRGLAGVAVHNCYGPTEATVEALVADVTGADAASPTATIGRPTARMTAYVLDSRLRPVPLGVTGELYLAGPQVTRGYLGLPGQTADRFVADPFAVPDPGSSARRMYRTGDLVSRSADGSVRYLGRADDQVKVRGYRIEIGEIESALRRTPGVRDAAAVVVRRGGGAGLVGFIVTDPAAPADPVAVRVGLSDRLPSYMIPSRLLVVDALPVTGNGKLDGKVLAARAAEAMATAAGSARPGTPTEHALVALVAEVFDGAAPGIDDDFFDMGLDSIVAISLASVARDRGLAVTARMIATVPNIRDLAAAIDAGIGLADEADAGEAIGVVPPLPYPAWMFRQPRFRRLSHTVLLRAPRDLDSESLVGAVQAMVDTHDALRTTLVETADGPRQVIGDRGTVAAAALVREVSVTAGATAELDVEQQVSEAVATGVEELNPATGDVVRLTWLRGMPDGDLVAVTIHHLAVDVVSWSVLIPGLAQAYSRLRAGEEINPVAAGTSYRRWSAALDDLAADPEVRAEQQFWADQLGADRSNDAAQVRWGSVRITEVVSSAVDSARLVGAASRTVGVREILLTALTLALLDWSARPALSRANGVPVALESHGRGGATPGLDELDVSATVGWFTSVYPVRLGAGSTPLDLEVAQHDPEAVRSLHAQIGDRVAAVPGDGLGYGLLRDIARLPELVSAPEPEVEFNYLGRLDLGFDLGLDRSLDQGTDSARGADWSVVTDPAHTRAIPSTPEPDLTLRFGLNVVSAIHATATGPELLTTLRWSDELFTADEIDQLADRWRRAVPVVTAALLPDDAPDGETLPESTPFETIRPDHTVEPTTETNSDAVASGSETRSS